MKNPRPFLILFTCLSLVPMARTARADDPKAVAAGVAAFRTGAFAEAYEAWSAAEQAGDARAARYLGVMWDTGEGVRQDQANAVRWYRRAAELGDAAAMFNVGVSYDAGRVVPRDAAAAVRWYRRAAARHHGRAEYDLALMLEDGDGVPRDHAAAQRLFAAAAADGIVAARSHLAPTRKVVMRVPAPDDNAAFLLAQRALLSRDPHDATVAFGLFLQAAAGHGPGAAMAQYDLGWCYENGIGIAIDRPRAYALYRQVAAETDDAVLRQLAVAGTAAMREETLASKSSPESR